MSQFNLFSKLPAELRVMIWDFAIRDNSPAAHFFCHGAFDRNFTVDPERRFPAPSGRNGRTWRFGLSAPQNSPNNEYSWVDGNPSAYMIDSGLWTACRESRERMIRHFHPNKASSPVMGPLDRQWCLESDAPVTLPFRRDNGERQELTIRPSEDLLCLQFAKGPAFYGNILQNLPTFRRRRPGGVGYEATHPRHVAIAFDPEWLEPQIDLLFPSGRFYFDDVVSRLAGFWFITRTLERRYKTDEDRSSRRTFRAAGGMELVEVRGGDDEWWDSSWGPHASDTRWPYRSRAEDLAEHLSRTVGTDEMFLSEEEDEGSDDGADDRLPARRFGVLACVTPGSETHLPTKSEWMDGCPQQLDSPGDETWYCEVSECRWH